MPGVEVTSTARLFLYEVGADMTIEEWKELSRRILLMVVDAIERDLGIEPTTCQIREMYKRDRLAGDNRKRR